MLGEFLDHAMVLVHAWLFTEKGTRFFSRVLSCSKKAIALLRYLQTSYSLLALSLIVSAHKLLLPSILPFYQILPFFLVILLFFINIFIGLFPYI